MLTESGIIPLADFHQEVNRQFVPGKTAHGLVGQVVQELDSLLIQNLATIELQNYATTKLTS
jgi:hypothetical protein